MTALNPFVEAARAMGWRIINSAVIQDRDPGDEDAPREWADSLQVIEGPSAPPWRVAVLDRR